MEVGEYAYQLGEKYLTSPEKVSIAGYLHDISAVYPNNQRISVAQKYGIELNETEMAFPMIIHQKFLSLLRKWILVLKTMKFYQLLNAIQH